MIIASSLQIIIFALNAIIRFIWLLPVIGSSIAVVIEISYLKNSGIGSECNSENREVTSVL